jgi:5'-AMP-activated protein kinase, regulatory beta subunit
VAPLQKPTEFSPVFNHSPTNGSDEHADNCPKEKGIPTLITWSQGGTEVFLEGSWDNWTSRYVLSLKSEFPSSKTYFYPGSRSKYVNSIC